MWVFVELHRHEFVLVLQFDNNDNKKFTIFDIYNYWKIKNNY